ncbi:hypothetical protein QBC46DRAFT_91819 [Diplogelasinospora grovesii]|uniref:Uncharacterized protein n=1 Tax=Diplogelasinospora grovesii TaxID=303347 RepID=A0AAN6N9M2_9PEZI|nr:hypothetical protein QBC46DRAFT_91819 [Diplogelasinospora grovesii]
MSAHPHHRPDYDDSVFTRNWCVAGLVTSWFVAIGSLLGGGICLYLQLRDGNAVYINLSHMWREILPLVLNIFVTLLNDSMGYIHTCSLRWALQREGKLDFSSNLRLLTASRLSRPNGMIANTLYLIGIIFAYGSTSLIFLSMNPDLARLLGHGNPDAVDTNQIHINAVALLMFGLGLFLQAVITNWALVVTYIPTWSSNPLDVARACLDKHSGHRIARCEGRCMMSVHQRKDPPGKYRPVRKQKPMLWAHPRVIRILLLLWALPILSGIWGGGIQAYIMQGHGKGVLGRSWMPLPVFTGITDTNCPLSQCTDGTSVLNVGWSVTNGTAGTLGAVLLINLFQSVVSLALHCAELIVNLSRDEVIYRELIAHKGTNGHYNSIWAAFTSWQTITLFAFKAGVHWMFGLAINLQFQLGVNMYPPQIFYFAGFSLFAALFGLYLSLRRPDGYLPASYGHLQTMVDIIDEWADSGCMFWGHKGDGNPAYAGTSTGWLKIPMEHQEYGGDPPARHSRQSGYSGTSTELNTMNPAVQVSPPPQYPFPPHMQQQQFHTHPQNRPSRQSMNSNYSRYSGYSGQSDESTQPFLRLGGC